MKFGSPPASSNKPSWQTLVNKRNQQLSSPPLQKDQPPSRRASHEDVSPSELALHDELMPLFKTKTHIEYKPREDDKAARVYGLSDNRAAERRHSSMKPLDLDPDGPAVSGYHFDELFRDD